MIRESEVRERLAAVVRGALCRADFEDWLESASWSMHRDSSPVAVELASSIHLLLSERDEGMLDDAGLRRELLLLLNNVRESLVIGDGVSTAPSPGVRASASRASWVRPAPLVLAA